MVTGVTRVIQIIRNLSKNTVFFDTFPKIRESNQSACRETPFEWLMSWFCWFFMALLKTQNTEIQKYRGICSFPWGQLANPRLKERWLNTIFSSPTKKHPAGIFYTNKYEHFIFLEGCYIIHFGGLCRIGANWAPELGLGENQNWGQVKTWIGAKWKSELG